MYRIALMGLIGLGLAGCSRCESTALHTFQRKEFDLGPQGATGFKLVTGDVTAVNGAETCTLDVLDANSVTVATKTEAKEGDTLEFSTGSAKFRITADKYINHLTSDDEVYFCFDKI